MPSPAHAEWPLPAGGLPWPPPGNEQEVLANPRRYPDSRPGRHAAVKSSYPLITGPSYDDLPPEWPRVKPLKSLMLPDSHFEFVDQSHEAGREYPHEADPRIHSPKFYRPSARGSSTTSTKRQAWATSCRRTETGAGAARARTVGTTAATREARNAAVAAATALAA